MIFATNVIDKIISSTCRRQLLHNCLDITEGRMDVGDRSEQLVLCPLHGREIPRDLSGTFDRSANTGKQ